MPVRVYIGCYTEKLGFVDGAGSGITTADVDMATGAVTVAPGTAVTRAGPNPTYLTVDSAGKALYAVSECYDTDSAITAFAIGSDGGLTPNGDAAVSRGTAACAIMLDSADRSVYVANYMSGSVIVVPVNRDLSLASDHSYFEQFPAADRSGVDPGRQADSCHAHQMTLDPSEKFCYVPDLGADMVRQYKCDVAKGTLLPLDPVGCKMAPGAGPRHMVFHPTLPLCYVLHELHSTVVTCAQHPATGKLTVVGDSLPTLPPDVKVGPEGASFSAAIRFDKNGNVYCSNRGHDSITRFTVGADGMLSFADRTLTGGKTPRDFVIVDSKLMIVADQDSGTIDTLFVSPDGKLTLTGKSLSVGTPSVVCAVSY